MFEADVHPKKDMGKREIPFSGSVYIDSDDFSEVRLSRPKRNPLKQKDCFCWARCSDGWCVFRCCRIRPRASSG